MAQSGFKFGNIFAAGPLYGDKPDWKRTDDEQRAGPPQSGSFTSATFHSEEGLQIYHFEEDQDIKIGRNSAGQLEMLTKPSSK